MQAESCLTISATSYICSVGPYVPRVSVTRRILIHSRGHSAAHCHEQVLKDACHPRLGMPSWLQRTYQAWSLPSFDRETVGCQSTNPSVSEHPHVECPVMQRDHSTRGRKGPLRCGSAAMLCATRIRRCSIERQNLSGLLRKGTIIREDGRVQQRLHGTGHRGGPQHHALGVVGVLQVVIAHTGEQVLQLCV